MSSVFPNGTGPGLFLTLRFLLIPVRHPYEVTGAT
jgi:hypothetical protein